MERWYWYPPNGGPPLEFGLSPPYVLMSKDLGSNEAEAQTVKAPFQVGETAIDVLVRPRRIRLTVAVLADTHDELQARMRELMTAMAIGPKAYSRTGELPLGVLSYVQRVMPDGTRYQMVALPERSPRFPGGRSIGRTWAIADIELLCPDPLWRKDPEVSIRLSTAGGWQFPIEFVADVTIASWFFTPSQVVVSYVASVAAGWQMPANDAEHEVVNNSDLAVPVFMRVYGPASNPTLYNLTTGESIGVMLELAPGEILEIDTTFGQRRVERIDGSGNRYNTIQAVNLDAAAFWWLRPGANRVRLSGVSQGGYATLTWREAYLLV